MNDETELPTPRLQALPTGSALAPVLPRSLEDAFRLATAVHRAGLAPFGMETADKVLVAILTGLELGVPPMQAIQGIAVINGRPCIWGDLFLGLITRSDLCLYVEEWIEGKGDERVAYCETHRAGRPKATARHFSVDDAKQAGLWQTEARVVRKTRDGSSFEKDNDSPWFRYQERMLQMRARSRCLRDVYPDLLKGIATREEVEDLVPELARDVTPQPTPSSISDRLKAAGAEPKVDIQAHVAAETKPSTVAEEPAPPAEAPAAAAAELERPALPSPLDYSRYLFRATTLASLGEASLAWLDAQDNERLNAAAEDKDSPWARVFDIHRYRVETGKTVAWATAQVAKVLK